jgi:hypothetical protein
MSFIPGPSTCPGTARQIAFLCLTRHQFYHTHMLVSTALGAALVPGRQRQCTERMHVIDSSLLTRRNVP